MGEWSIRLATLAVVLVVLALHEVGRWRLRRAVARWRPWCFRGGVAAVVVALVSPLEHLATVYLWARMAQDVTLVFVVPPLVLLGSPWLPWLAALPPAWRRRVLGGLYRSPSGVVLRSTGRWLLHPAVATAALLVAVVGWYQQGAVGAQMGHPLVAVGEQLSLVVVGVWYWAQLVGSHPYRPRAAPLRRLWSVALLMVVDWCFVSALAFASHPWFPRYASVAGHSLPLMTDQGLAAAFLWVVPMAALGGFACWVGNCWLRDDADEDARLRRLLRSDWTPTGSGTGAPPGPRGLDPGSGDSRRGAA
ncbi:MAG: cytochrome c oxidase assembly protein [Acidimicrobiales bacterium]